MAFFLPAPPPKKGGGFSQFIQGVGEGVGDDLPQLLNDFFEQKNLTKLQTDLSDVGSVFEKTKLINSSRLSEENKNNLIKEARFTGLQSILADLQEGKEITDEQLLEQLGDRDAVALLSNLQKQQREGRKTEAQASKDYTDYRKKAVSEVQELIGKETWDDLSVQEKIDFKDFADRAWKQTLDVNEALDLVRDRYRDYEGGEGEQAQKEKSFFERGSEASIAGRAAALARGQPLSEYEKETSLPQNTNLLDRTLYGLGKFVADSPFYFAGGTAGALAGGALGAAVSAPTVVGVPFAATAGSIAGGGFGTFAVPAMVEKGLTLFQDYLEKGGEASFGDFLDAGAETLQSGIDAGVEGAIFGTLTKLKPLLSKSPVFKKLFNMKGLTGKVAQEATLASFQTGGILGSRVASGQKVTGDDAADLFTQVFGFNVMQRLSPKLKKTVAKKIEKSGIEPQDFTENVKERLKSQDKDPNNPAHLTQAINDVSKEYSKAKEVFKEAPKAEVGREQLEKGRAEKQKLAERITEEPVKEILERKKPTKKVQAAMKEVSKTENLLKQELKNREVIENSINRGSAQQKKTNQQALKLINNEVTRLENQVETQKKVVESLKPKKTPEPTQAEFTEQAKLHNEELMRAAKNPESVEAKKLESLFDRDQKYITELASKIGKEPLPSPKNLDRRLRALHPYEKSYQNLLKSIDNQLKMLEGEKGEGVGKIRKDLTETRRLLNKNLKINQAKQALHKPKVYVREVARGKGDAYLKNLLKNMGNSAKEFEKDFFKVKKILDAPETKIATLGKKGIQEATTKLVKEPTQAQAKVFEQKTGVPAKQALEAVNTGKSEGARLAEQIKKGVPWEKIEGISKKVYDRYKKASKFERAILGGIFFGGVQEVVNSAFDIKLPISLISFAFPGSTGIRYGASLLVNATKQIYKKAEEIYWKSQLKKASITQKSNIRTKLRSKGWTPTRIKKLRS